MEWGGDDRDTEAAMWEAEMAEAELTAVQRVPAAGTGRVWPQKCW